MGALSGVTLIGIAIAAFVVIVSAQVFHEWPIAETGAHAPKSGLAPAKALNPPGGVAAPNEATAASGADPALRANRGKAGAANTGTVTAHRKVGGDPSADDTGPATAVESPSGAGTGGEESSTSGGNTGSHSSQPSTSPSQAGSPSSGNSSGNATSGGSTGASGSGNTSTGSGQGGGSTGSSGGGTGETPVTATTKPSVAEGVNETVHGVDEAALGGTLENTGATEVTEGVVNEAAGPETVVGKTVEGAGEAVGGLVGGKSSSGE